MKVINRTAHLIMTGGVKMVPGLPCECDFNALKKKYPKLTELEAGGKLQVVSEEQAVKEEKALEDMAVRELKSYAEKNGIDLSGKTKKADILEAISEKQ